MRLHIDTAVAIALCTLISACAGGGPMTPAGKGAPAAAATGNIAFRIRVPKVRRNRRLRIAHDGRPSYVSPATQGMTVGITGPSSLTETVGLSASSTGCTSTLAGTSCALLVSGLQPCVPLSNCYVATIATYDAVSCQSTCTIPPGANELSAAQNVHFSVAAAQMNAVNLTLGGVPASLTVSPLKPGYLQGDASGLKLWGAAAQSLLVEARDADGDAIVGPGAPAITAVSRSNSLTVTNPSKNAPELITLRATTFGVPSQVNPGVVPLQLSAVPPAQSGALELVQSTDVRIAHSAVYVGGGASVAGFYDGNTSAPNVTIAGASTGLDIIQCIALDSNGTLYAVNKTPSVTEYHAGADGNVPPSVTISGANTKLASPSGCALDANDTLYVGDWSENVFEFANGSSGNVAPTATIGGGATGLNIPEGLAIDPSGTLYVSDYSTPAITEYAAGATGNITPIISIAGANTGISQPVGIAIDGSGQLVVANDDVPSITTYAAGASGNASPSYTIAGAGANLGEPLSVAIDASGKLFVANVSWGGFTEYADSGSTSPIESVQLSIPARNIAVVPAMGSR